jgi:polyhydroxybutyrate depolymerase
MPVIFNLHGMWDNATWQMGYTLMNDVADTAGFIAVYPNAIYPGFNTGVIDPDFTLPDVDDVGFISAIIDTLVARYDIDMNRVYVCGFSNGAHMTFKLVCQLRHRFAAGASVAGALLNCRTDNCPVGAIPILICNGTRDKTIPYDGGIDGTFSVEETLNFWLNRNNCSLQADTLSLPQLDSTDARRVDKISYTNCSDETEVIFYKVIGGGHNWPSGVFSGIWAGYTTKDINASVEIWNFFKNFENLSYVHPGDTDNNGKVEANDILPLGVYFLNEGKARKNASVSWTLQEVVPWEVRAISYADANGDGRVDEKDVVAIGVNWGNTHSNIGKSYQISLADKASLNKYRENFQTIYNALQDNSEPSREIKNLLQNVFGIEESVPESFMLYQNYPNPFNPKTTISYQLPVLSDIELTIYNMLGHKVVTLAKGEQDPGIYKYEWNASNFSSGLYFYKLETKNGFLKIGKMLLMK